MRDDPSRTAEVVCLFRAGDQRRRPEERIVDDPYAKLFLGPLTRAGLLTLEATGRFGELAESYAPGLATYVLARHRFIDDALVRALKTTDRPFDQVVILGAGYDTRAYRFAGELQNRPVFELDFPATSRRKAEIVADKASELPSAAPKRVEIDFLTEKLSDKLEAAGFVRSARSFFIWEGVSMYLTRKAVQDTLKTIRALSAPGSHVAMDFWYYLDTGDFASVAHNLSQHFLYFLGEPITLSIHPEDVGPFMERLGFGVLDLAEAGELERRYVHDDRSVQRSCYVLCAETRR